MSTVLLYFGDAFWCTVPYNGLELYYELSKTHKVIPVFMNNDIRLHKTWRGDEKFWFDVNEFKKIPYIETNNLLNVYRANNCDMCIMPCQMQHKEKFAARNRNMKNAGAILSFWDCGGADLLYCNSDGVGWNYFFAKGDAWKNTVCNSISPIHNSKEDSKLMFSCGSLDFDELFLNNDLVVKIDTLSKLQFCKKYDLDSHRPIIAYIPSNPRPDNNYTYPSGITARQALNDINNTLTDLIASDGYQICFKTHPGDYISTESQSEYHGLHPRAQLGGYDKPRYETQDFNNFTTISAEDGYNLYRNCDFGVTNYSHAGFELSLVKKPVISYRMKECIEWQYVENLCELVYTDAQDGNQIKDIILNSKFKDVLTDRELTHFFGNVDGTAYKNICKSVDEILSVT